MIFGIPAGLFWFLLLMLSIGIEFLTIFDKKPNNTFSVSLAWAARVQPFTRMLLVGSFAWLNYHFFYEDDAAAKTKMLTISASL